MANVTEFKSKPELAKLLGTEVARLQVEPYIYDPRTKWDLHIVTIDGSAAGFTDGPVWSTTK
jgi:hypothetical protein